MHITIEKLFLDQIALIGAKVELEGRLIVSGPITSFFAASYEKYKAGEKILLIDDGKVAREMLKKLPPYGGGDCIYDEVAIVTGVVQLVNGNTCLTDIATCTVFRNETTIQITL